MDSENMEYTWLFFRFNGGQPRSGNLYVWISHWESLLGRWGWLNSSASEEEMPMESSVCFLLPLSALFTQSRWEEAHLSTLLAQFSIQRKLSFVKVSFKTKVLWSPDIKRDHALKPDSAVRIYIWFYYRWTLLLHNILRGPPAVSCFTYRLHQRDAAIDLWNMSCSLFSQYTLYFISLLFIDCLAVEMWTYCSCSTLYCMGDICNAVPVTDGPT